ncbi:hypothetical protein Metev_0894 [Methanohalobium evestigatum Z-7303]|uniref:Uncharacterized protein n=1 Tax=Methanohalobium evestigatum (strain ATCC BAA-1072 / DSM 3721 / NBRC 107634 / OCM 161 / Z-7303) TaxID=644295 RepID=D7E8X0_METEZ|nr:hypothetical protein [Methanohalobium evestigatum]ADI73791.1 hypothetical protein Metev_0894 [Methanohalobium evestigatum Z-7303]
MKLNTKKILTCLTVILLIISTIPITVSASEDRGRDTDDKRPEIAKNKSLNESEKENQEEELEEREEKIERKQERIEEKIENKTEKREEKLEKKRERIENKNEKLEEKLEERKEKIERKHERVEERIKKRKEQLENARNNYAKAKSNFHSINKKVSGNKLNPNSEKVINATKNYLNSTLDYMIEHLENKKTNINASNANFTDKSIEDLNEYINELKQKRVELKSAETREEISEISDEIREIWRDAQTNSNSIAIKTVNERINEHLEKSKSISLRIEKEIKQLEAEGKNVSDVEKLLNGYKEKISNIKEHQSNAEKIYSNATDEKSIKDAKLKLQKAISELKEANIILKEIFKQIKDYRNDSIKLDGQKDVNASGDGTAVLSGNLDINISTADAKMVIKDFSGDAKVNITGNYSKVNRNKNKPEGLKDNRALVYHGLIGNINVSGSSLTVMVNGENIELNADGVGSIVFSEGDFGIENSSNNLKVGLDEDIKNTTSSNTSSQYNNTTDNTSVSTVGDE